MRTSFVVFGCLIIVAVANLLPLFVPNSNLIILSGAAGLLTVVGAYIKLDLSAIAEGSRRMPVNDGIHVDRKKYLVMIVSMLIITLECLVVSMYSHVDLEQAIAMYIFASLGIAACYVSGIKENTKAVKEGKEVNNDS